MAGSTGAATVSNPPPPHWVEISIDPLGYGTLRGTVKNEEARQGLIEKTRRLPGVTGIIDHLQIQPDTVLAPAAAPVPPPPVPQPPPPGPVPPPDPEPARKSLGDRVRERLLRSPALVNLSIRVEERDGTVTLEGGIPSILDDLHALRVVQQTPGVLEIVDRLAFPIPELGQPNPLITQGRPEDVEPYLEARLRQLLGTEAHIDRVRIFGDQLEVRGTVTDVEARRRILSTLRTLVILRGYRVKALLVPEGEP